MGRRGNVMNCGIWLLRALLLELTLPPASIALSESKLEAFRDNCIFRASENNHGRIFPRQIHSLSRERLTKVEPKDWKTCGIQRVLNAMLDLCRNYRESWENDFREVCIPTASQILENHEGRHECAYDHPNGFRAVGVGYNLDDSVDARRTELSVLFADYDKIYKTESCLWDIQISLLLAFDTKRDLDNAAKFVGALDDFCCPVMAVFADIQHSLKDSNSFPFKDVQVFIEKAAAREWSSAAHELNHTNWCSENLERCSDNVAIVNSGCISTASLT